ncbi:MAG: TolC family protein [Rhodothermales bacterium]
MNPLSPVRALAFLALIAGLVVPLEGAAQVAPAAPYDTTAAVGLTLGDAVRLALTQSVELERAGYTVALRALDLRAARAAGDPELSVSGGPAVRYARGYATDFFGNPDDTDPEFDLVTEGETSAGVTASAQFSLPLFDGGARRANRRAAERVLDAARLDLDRAAEDVASQAATQYLQVLQFADIVRVETTNLEAERALLDRVQAEYDVGNRNISDVLQQRAAIALGEQRLATARRNEAVARLGLRQTLRLPPGTPLDLAPAPDDLLTRPLLDLDVAELVALAFAERPDLDAQALLVEAAGFDIRAARAGRYPNLSLGGSAGTSFNTLDDNSGFGGQFFDVNPNTSAGLTLSIPILDQGRTRRAVERAQVLVSDADAALDLQQLRVAADVETAVLDVEAAAARLAAATEAVAAAREALAATEARYRVGAGIFLDVLDARRVLVQAETDVAAARYDLLIGRIAVAYQTGLLGEALVALD